MAFKVYHITQETMNTTFQGELIKQGLAKKDDCVLKELIIEKNCLYLGLPVERQLW